MAALSNARLSPLNISVISWVALIGAGVGAYVWVTAGNTHRARSLIGLGMWLLSFALIVIKV